MTTRKTAAPRPATKLDTGATYRVAMMRPVATEAFVYRPGEEHVMTGMALKILAEAADADPAEIAAFEKVEG